MPKRLGVLVSFVEPKINYCKGALSCRALDNGHVSYKTIWTLTSVHSRPRPKRGVKVLCATFVVFLFFPSSFFELTPGQTLLPTQANSSQVFNFDRVGCRLTTHLDGVGLNLIKFKCSPNSSKVFDCLATWANSSQVVLLLSCDCAVVVRPLNGLLVSWLDLAVPFGHPPMQVSIF